MVPIVLKIKSKLPSVEIQSAAETIPDYLPNLTYSQFYPQIPFPILNFDYFFKNVPRSHTSVSICMCFSLCLEYFPFVSLSG